VPEPPFHFKGFSAPGYTMVPDEYFDLILSHLTGVECKVLDYIFRRTFGFKKDSDRISLSQMVNGIVKADGERLDSGVGESRSGVVRALAGLEAKGIIKKTKVTTERNGHETNVYSLVFQDPSAGGLGWSAGEPAPSRPAVQPSSPAHTQETDVQETDRANAQETEATALWLATLDKLRGRFPRSRMADLEDTRGLRMDGGTLIVAGPARLNELADFIRHDVGQAVRFEG
jgi:hypothetical protein